MNPFKGKLLWSGLLLAALASISPGTHAQTLIPSKFALPKGDADTSKPGFIWNVHQTPGGYVGFPQNDNARTEAQLAGELKNGAGEVVPNHADPGAVGSAKGAGAGPTPAGTGLVTFEVETVINFDQAGGSNGRFTPDDQMPGIPGIEGNADNIAGEVLTYLALTPGTYRMVVNSDDGFVCYIGGVTPQDKFAVKVGEFNGGRGAADTLFQFKIEKEGLYPARVIWEEGGGGANLEWFTLKADDTRVLVNDTANGGIAAYRGVKTASVPAYASKVVPAPGGTGAPPDATIQIVLQNAGAVNAADVKLSLDGAVTTATATKSGSTISLSHKPATLLDSGSKHTVSVTYGAEKLDWEFTTSLYATLTAAYKVTPDTSKRGFIWRVTQNNAVGTQNFNKRTEHQLAGLFRDADGIPLPNQADPSAVGGADGPSSAPNPAWAPIEFQVSKVINFDQAAGSNGAFTPDEQMPGIPGVEGGADAIAAEIITYLDLPAGLIKMGVNSDDGFRTTAGAVGALADGLTPPQFGGEFSGGRGAADTIFSVVVKDPGVYAFRTIWEEGGGGANIEWFTLKADGSKVLVNDDANGGVKAYRAILPTGTKAVLRKVEPAANSGGATGEQPILAELVDGASPIDRATVKLKLDGAEVAATTAKQGSVTTVTFKPASPFASKSVHTAQLSYTEGGAAVTREWTFTAINKDLVAYFDFNDASDPAKAKSKVGGYVGEMLNGAKYTDDAKGRTGKAGDRAAKIGSADPVVNGTIRLSGKDVSFMNLGGMQNQLSVSLWQRLDVVKNSSVLWSRGAGGERDRTFQAHTPWGDSVIYFDTGGACCNATERLNANISTFADFTGDANDFFGKWRHIVLQKNGDHKQIWIDGKLFLENMRNTAPLHAEFTQLNIGSDSGGGNNTHGDIDDFAVFASALTAEEVGKLFAGTPPDQVRPITVAGAKFTKFAKNADGSITIEWTGGGTLQAAGAVTGPWQDVPGAASPYTFKPTGAALFGRIKN